MAGKLCISVIEARNVQADDFAERNFYVKLRIGPSEVKTDIVKGSMQPKFLKDCRLAVPMPESDTLRIELLQVGPRGDLVVGTDELRILTVTARGTIVHWFQLRTPGRSVAAELCLVLRFLSAGANRPMSPTYAIAARQAKERALEAPTTPTGPAKSAFHDLPAASPTTAGSVAMPPSPQPHTPPAPLNGNASPAAASPAAAVAAAGAPSPRAGASPLAASTASGAARPGAASVASSRGGPRAAPRSGGPGRSRSGSVPLPLAVLGGMVMGALVYLWRKRPVYYEVQEDDTLCHIASCFKKRVDEVYARNRDLLRSHPNRLYPGDRLRIR